MDRVVRLNAITVAIVTVPLLLVAIMAINAVMSDKAASRASAKENALQLARFHGSQIVSRTDAFMAAQLQEISSALTGQTDIVGNLRISVHGLAPPFVAVFEGDRRIFPPEDNAILLFQERQMLSQFGTELSSAVEATSKDTNGSAWSAFNNEPILLTCEQTEALRVLCIAAMLSDVRQVISAALSHQAALARQPIELVDPWGQHQWPLDGHDFNAENSASYELSDTFRNWTVRVGVDTSTASETPLILAIAIPVIVGWGLSLIALLRFKSEVARQNQMRADSTARLSHDLRTPIANLAIYAELIARHGRDSPAIARYCSALEAEINRLAHIADNTLRRSRGLPQHSDVGEAVAIDDVVQSTLSRYEPLLAKSGCTMTLDTQAPKIVVEDRPALERILVNLIDNVRSHAAGANVEIATRTTGSGVLLSITDDGAKSASAAGGVKDGHGLGLKVVEELVRLRGGAFKAFIGSAGSRFEIVLPAAAIEEN